MEASAESRACDWVQGLLPCCPIAPPAVALALHWPYLEQGGVVRVGPWTGVCPADGMQSHTALVITVFLSRPLAALYACAMSPIQSSSFFSKLTSMFKALGFSGARTGSPEVTAGLAPLSLPVSCTSC